VIEAWSKDPYLQYLFGKDFYLIENKIGEHEKKLLSMRTKFSKHFGWWSIFYTIAESNLHYSLNEVKKSDAYEMLKYYVINHKLKV